MLKKIYIEITNVCNLKCSFCPVSTRPKEFMSVDNFEKIIKKIHKYTKLVCLHVKGEPLLHPNLDKFLDVLEKYNMKANITTNGTLIKEKLEVLKNSKAVRQINFSIHSITENKEINEQYLLDVFSCVEKLEHIIISYRLWNLENIKENDVNNNIIRMLQQYYKIDNLKEIIKK